MKDTIELLDPVSGFTHREQNSKALLQTDSTALLRYKIQRKRLSEINRSTNELQNIRSEVNQLKNDLSDIKEMLSQVINR